MPFYLSRCSRLYAELLRVDYQDGSTIAHDGCTDVLGHIGERPFERLYDHFDLGEKSIDDKSVRTGSPFNDGHRKLVVIQR